MENPLDYAVEGVVLEIQLGAVTQRVALEQAVIPPNGIAPYQARFETRAASNGIVRLIGAWRSIDAAWVTLEADAAEVEAMSDGRFAVSADIVNAGDAPAHAVRAVVTLLESGQVIGYRAVDFGAVGVAVEAGGRLPLRVIVAAQIAVERPDVHIYIEGRERLPE